MPLLRIACPREHTHQVERVLAAEGGCQVAVLAAAGWPERSDLLLVEIRRAQVDQLLARIRELAIPAGVRVAVQPAVGVLPPEPLADEDAVIWAQVTRELKSAGRLSWPNTLLIVAAAVIAAIGIVQGQLLLIVGAMALSADYFPIVDTCLALSRRAWADSRRGGVTLVTSFAAAAAGAWLLTEVLTALRLVDPATAGHPSLTSFIAHPDPLSMVVALVAGAAGALAVTLPDMRGLVGVFVSITTIPAAANIGVAVAARDAGEVAGAGVQLLANVAGLLVAGTITLAVRHRGQTPT